MTARAGVSVLALQDAAWHLYVATPALRDEAIRRMTKTGLTQKAAINKLACRVAPSMSAAGIGRNGFEVEVATHLLPGLLDSQHRIEVRLARIEALLYAFLTAIGPKLAAGGASR